MIRRECYCGQNSDDRNYDHQLDQGKTLLNRSHRSLLPCHSGVALGHVLDPDFHQRSICEVGFDYAHRHAAPTQTRAGRRAGVADGTTQLYDVLTGWVEKGVAPRRIDIFSAVTTTFPVPKSRPICVYPKKGTYVGGDVNVASSYVCAGSRGGNGHGPGND
ncbi:MAG: tannase/feruloyl esterase family alpha/beta hydrolase, partial [Betaproteobacteria bacterium]